MISVNAAAKRADYICEQIELGNHTNAAELLRNSNKLTICYWTTFMIQYGHSTHHIHNKLAHALNKDI